MDKTVCKALLAVLISLTLYAGIEGPLSPAMAEDKEAEIFVQLGHTSFVKSVAFSPDGRYALSGSEDKTLKLWDASTGREIRTFTGHTERVKSIAFSPDGRYALSGSWDNTLRLWDIQTGREIKTINTSDVNSVAFSPDGRYALSGSFTLKLWDIQTGKEIKTFTGHRESVNSVAFSPDGMHVLSGSSDKTLKLWDIETGREIRTFTGHADQVNSVAFSPDGRYALSGSGYSLSGSPDKTLKLWDIQTGREIRTFTGHTGDVKSVAFSPDGRYALSGSGGYTWSGGWDNTLKLWDIQTGKEIRTFIGHTSPVESVVFSPDGRYALSGSWDKTLRLWDIQTGMEIRMFRGHADLVNSVAFSPSGKYALAGGFTLKIWDIQAGREAIKPIYGQGFLFSPTVSTNGRYALLRHHNFLVSDGSFKLWDIQTGIEIRTFWGHEAYVYSMAFSPTGRYALSGSMDKTIKLWEIQTGEEIRTFTGHTGNVISVAFSPDGRYALSGSEDKTLKLWDIQSGKEIRTFTGHTSPVESVVFSPDGRYALSGSSDKTLKLWHIETGREIRTFTGHADLVNSVALSPDGRYALSGSWDTSLKLWDIQTGMEIRTFKGHADDVDSVVFSPDGRYALSGSRDGTVRIWDISTGRNIAQFITFTDGEWVVITPEGYYNSSSNGDKYLNVRIGNNVYGIDQYRATYYRPKIVETSLRLGDSRSAIAEVLGEQNISIIQNIEPPFVVIKSPDDGKKVTSKDAEISLYVEDRNQTIKKLKVFVNGRLVTGDEARGVKIIPKARETEAVGIAHPTDKKTLDLKIPVNLDAGENLIEVAAFNGFSEGRKSIRVYSEVKGTKDGEVILPNLWILSIGINKYQDKKLTSLSYAVADAEGIVKAFNSQKGKLFREVNSFIISDNTPTKPTRDNITDNLDFVKKAGHNDIVLLFIAGHGINDESGEFYLLPSDAVISEDGSIKKSKAISWRDIRAILEIPAKKLIFADTCHSEGVSGKKTRGVDNDRFVKELQEANAVIFTSSRGRELSQESDKWKHGAFTYALIEGIKGKADLIKDNKVSMKELDTYVSEAVPQITNGAQHPITNTPDGYVNFPVALIGQ